MMVIANGNLRVDLKLIADMVEPGSRVLDVGCGCGATTLDFAQAVGPAGRVTALDISGPMLAEGRARAKAAGIGNVDWRQADAARAISGGCESARLI